MNNNDGRLPDGTGLPINEAVPSSPTVGIPDAGMLPNITYLSCSLCHGKRVTQWGPCTSCADPDPVRARWMLERLSEQQIDFLRAYSHTLAYQPVTGAEYDKFTCEFWVEDDDGIWDEDAEFWLIPNTKHWFASGMHRFGPCGSGSFIRYNPMGLLLRECLMCGTDANVPHMYPARHAQGIEAGTVETERLDAQHESPVRQDAPKACSEETSHDH